MTVILRVLRVLRSICFFIFDPIVFVSIVAPSTIFFALAHIEGRLAVNIAEGGAAVGMFSLFRHKAFPGLVDYVLQYYTAMIAFTLWASKSYRVVLEPYLFSKARGPELQRGVPLSTVPREAVSSIYLICGISLFVFGGYTLVLGGAASSGILEEYATHTTTLGRWQLPPWTSITVVRVLVAFMGMVLFFWNKAAVKMEQVVSPTP